LRTSPSFTFKLLVFAVAIGLSACSSCGEDPTGGDDDDTGVPFDSGVPPDSGDDPDGGPDTGFDPDGGPGDPDAGDAGDLGAPDGGADPNNPNNDMLDTDCDGLSDAEEFSTVYPDGNKTDPNNSDSDGDGISDGVEAGRTTAVTGSTCTNPAFDADPNTRTLPTDNDTDNDMILDGAEDQNRNGNVDTDESSPTSRDSDGDQISDTLEDTDLDGVRDTGELNPARRDTDGDEIDDGVEDLNRNATFDAGETNPLDNDTDDDSLADGIEDTNHDGLWQPYETDPRTPDTDCDGIADNVELANGTSPLVQDTDHDGITDGVETGVTGPVPGSNCPNVPVDLDPTTMTSPTNPDVDNDGLLDGIEDANHNGRVDLGETDPNDNDTDNDGLPDGDEIRAGFDPTNPGDPGMNVGNGITLVCGDANLKVVDFNIQPQRWTLSDEQSMTYLPITVSAAAVDVDVAALDDTTSPVSGFVTRMPLIAGQPMTAAGQNTALNARFSSGAAAENLAVTVRTSARNVTAHDGYETAVSGVIDVNVTSGTREAAEVRNALLRLATGLTAADFTGLPTNTPGATANQFTFGYQVLLRRAPDELVVVGAVLERSTYDSATNNSSIIVSDLTNGTALALAEANVDKDCDPFIAGDEAIADFLWMADISGSTDDDRGRIVSASNVVFNALATNGVDFRMGVIAHIDNDITQGAGNGGDMRGVGFTTDPNLFASYLQDTTGTNGCEFGLEAIEAGITKALPRSGPSVVDARKFRDLAQIAIIYISDEHAQEVTEIECSYDPGGAACDTGVIDYYSTADNNVCTLVPNAAQQACINQAVAPYITQLQNNGAIAFAQIISPAATPTACTGYACPQVGSQATNEPGIGYVEVVNSTGGTFYSPCVDNPGNALQAIVDAVTGAASQYQLTGNPISSTIKVGIARVGVGGNGMTDIVDRDKDNGFDYDPVANAIFFRGTAFRPNRDDVVIISYRVWLPPDDPCGGPCDVNMNCDPQLGVCTCDQAACTANCGPTQVCDANCACTCTPDCNGQCGPGETCNTTSCTCECAADCGGSCPAGTVCDQNACACVCDADCGGVCAATPPLVCDTGACNCQCPADCGGCPTGLECNESLCACACPADCECPGMGMCDPANNCACACPSDCGGACPDNTACNPTSCECECPADCEMQQGCINREVCDPNNTCDCYCPADCGGCMANETCDTATCRCIPVV
jgi:hypothetical protein